MALSALVKANPALAPLFLFAGAGCAAAVAYVFHSSMLLYESKELTCAISFLLDIQVSLLHETQRWLCQSPIRY